MTRCFVVLAIGFALVVAAAQPGYCSVAGVDVATKHWTAAPFVKAPGSISDGPGTLSRKRGGSFSLARGVDLRDVDWDKVKGGENGRGESKDGATGDKNGDRDDEAEEQDTEQKDENDEKEEAEDTAGWDRIWEAPKLG